MPALSPAAVHAGDEYIPETEFPARYHKHFGKKISERTRNRWKQLRIIKVLKPARGVHGGTINWTAFLRDLEAAQEPQPDRRQRRGRA